MKRITGNTLSGKKMRVAAMFTGAAAVATTFTPAFTATAKASGLIEESCTGRPTWLHIASGGGGLSCWGFKGGYSFYIPERGYAECGGNNYGFLYWTDYPAANDVKQVKYYQGTYYAYWPAGKGWSGILGIHISGWAGPDQCPGS